MNEEEEIVEEQIEPTYNAADKKSVNAAKKKSKSKEKKRLEVVQAIMAQPQGRAFMYDYLRRCSVFTTPFIAGQTDTTAFNAGRQSIGHDLQADIMAAAPETYWLMIQEAKI
jgi:hypothetical protein